MANMGQCYQMEPGSPLSQVGYVQGRVEKQEPGVLTEVTKTAA